MGFVRDVAEDVQNFHDDVRGKTGERAAKQAADTQLASIREAREANEAASERGLGFLEPFSGLGQGGVDNVGFLTDPEQQFDFIQNNPLFQLSLDNANRETKNLAASRSRVSAGDTLQRLSENVLLSASPLIQQQKQSIGDLLNFGAGIATRQGNLAINQGNIETDLITSGGDVAAGGIIGGANARGQGAANLINIGKEVVKAIAGGKGGGGAGGGGGG